MRLKANRTAIPARAMLVQALSSRYVLHSAIIVTVLFSLFANLQVRQAHAQDIVGQSSILYEMVANNDAKSTEQAVNPNLLVKDSHYAAGSSMIASGGGIDFDYLDTEAPPVSEPSMPGTLLANTLTPSAQPEDVVVVNRTQTETYTVKDGDTLADIARRFGINVGTILWANDRTATQILRPGDTLRIPPVSGVLVTVQNGDTLAKLANAYGVNMDEIAKTNMIDPSASLAAGLEIVIPGAQPLAIASPQRSVSRNYGVAPRSSDTLNESGAATPFTSLVANEQHAAYVQKPADANPGSAPIDKLLWPTSGHSITQYYSWHHTGVDIDGDYTSPLYAAHDGVVTTAGWNNGGYGLQVMIESDDGSVITRYGHSSKLFVKVGDHVKRGQVIAMMGTTGHSTGTHLHFEVYINGKRVNPLGYIK